MVRSFWVRDYRGLENCKCITILPMVLWKMPCAGAGRFPLLGTRIRTRAMNTWTQTQNVLHSDSSGPVKLELDLRHAGIGLDKMLTRCISWYFLWGRTPLYFWWLLEIKEIKSRIVQRSVVWIIIKVTVRIRLGLIDVPVLKKYMVIKTWGPWYDPWILLFQYEYTLITKTFLWCSA